MGATPLPPAINQPRMASMSSMSPVPPGMGELNYVQMLLDGITDQSVYTTSDVTFAGLTLTGLTASLLVGTSAAKALQSISVGSSLSLAGTTLNTAQGLRTLDSPTFAGLTIGSLSGILKAASGVVGAATIGSSLSYSAPTLNAIQDIRTTATPQFARIGLGVAAESGYFLTARGDPIGVGGVLKIENTNSVGWSGIHFFNSSNVLSAHTGWGNSGVGALANAAYFGSIANAPLHLSTNDTIRCTLTAAGLINCIENVSLGVADTNKSHYLRLICGSDITADRNLTFTTGDAARTITLNGNPTLNDWFDQAVKQASSPTFSALTLTGLLLTAASVAGGAKMRLPHGTAPDTPIDGDMWTTTAGLYVRINGVTVGPLS